METRFTDGERFTRDQVKHMLDLYCKTLSDLGYEPVPFPDVDAHVTGSIYLGARFDTLNHARWMCDQARDFALQGRWAKAHRWIGMVQGLLFVGGIYSISELKMHNRTP